VYIALPTVLSSESKASYRLMDTEEADGHRGDSKSIQLNICNWDTGKPGTEWNKLELEVVTRHIPSAANTQALCVYHQSSVVIG